MRNNKTPAMTQYFKMKEENPDCLMLFRMGDFYELFGDDAVIGSKILNITLTSRDRSDNKLPMAGFPYHALDNYLQKLIDANYKVGIVEQTTALDGNSGIMNRELVKIVTPGLNLSSDINNKENNFLFSVKNV
jgi:DNA mismatch repair protein MutS